MDWNLAASMARELMNQHGLGHIPLERNNRRRYAGITRSVRRFNHETNMYTPWTVEAIELSGPYVEINNEDNVRNTILHEIAHAIVGQEAGHGIEWRRQARAIGAKPERCDFVATLPKGKYQATCLCGETHYMFRMPKRGYHCRVCKQHLEFRKVE